jgi:ligand-binding sensor domain-containing protein
MRGYGWMAVVASLVVGLAVAAAAPKAEAAYYGGEEYSLTARHSGKCLDIEYVPWLYLWYGMKFFNTADGAAVFQSRCTGSGTPNQVWKLYLTGISGPIKLANKQSGKCLDVSGGNLVNYTSVVQMPCAESDSQLWYAYQVATFNGIPYYVLDNRTSGKCLEVAWASTADAAALVQANCTWGASQLWDLYNIPFNYHGK